MEKILASAPSTVADFGKTKFKLRPAAPVNSTRTAVVSSDMKLQSNQI